MSTYTDSRPHPTTRRTHRFPAYGPVDAALGLGLFYYLVGRATPTVVAVLTDAVPAFSASGVRLALAFLVWFVVAVTVIDQARRQLAALGVIDEDARTRLLTWVAPTEVKDLLATAVLLVFGVVAAWTFEPAMATAVSLVRVVATLDPGAVALGEVATLVAFSVSFALASQALDRLVVDGVRAMLAGERPEVA